MEIELDITYEELLERIRSNIDHCELVEILDLDIDDLLNILGGEIYRNKENFYFLDDDRYKEV